MKHKFNKYSARALSLVEVLGAVAVLATVVTVSVISVKDTVQSGQKASAQKEIQNLNTALENFKSAGGVILENATVTEAIAALQQGVDLAGSEYAPLVSVPESEVLIAGEAYSLAYDPEEGFSYGNADGTGITGAGTYGAALAATGGSYPFDISDPNDVAQAISTFSGIATEDPAYTAYSDAFRAARELNYLTDENIAELNPTFNKSGLYNDGSDWIRPIFDVTNPVVALSAAQALPGLADPQQYIDYVQSLNAALNILTGEDRSSVNAAMLSEFINNSRLDGYMGADWTQLDLTGANLGANTTIVTAKNLSGLNILGTQLNSASGLRYTNLSGLNLNGFSPAGRDLRGTILTNATGITGAELSSAWVLLEAQLSGMNLAGFNFTGRNLGQTNLSGVTGVTGSDLDGASSIVMANLSSIDLSGLNLAGRNIFGTNFTGATGITGAQLDTAANVVRSNFSGLNLTGFNPTGKNLYSADLSNVTGLTGAQFNGAADIRGVNFSGLNIAGFDPAGRNLDSVNLVGTTGIAGSQLNGVQSLKWANLANLNLSGFDLSGKNLQYTSFVNVSGLVPAEVARAQDLKHTNFSGTNISYQQLIDLGASPESLVGAYFD